MNGKHNLILIAAFGLLGLSDLAVAAEVSCDIKYSEAVTKDIDAEFAPIDIDMLRPIDECINKMQAENDPKRAALKTKVLEALNKAKKDCTAMKTMLITPGQPFPTEDKGRPTWCEDPDLNNVQAALAAYNGGTGSGAGRSTGGQGLSPEQAAAAVGGGAAAAVAGAEAASQTTAKKPGFFGRMKAAASNAKAKVTSFFSRKK